MLKDHIGMDVGHLMPMVANFADYRTTGKSLSKPITYRGSNSRADRDDDTQSHVECSMHLSGVDSTLRHRSREFWLRWQGVGNVPTKAIVQSQKVRQSTTGDVSDGVQVVSRARSPFAAVVAGVVAAGSE